MKIQAGIQGLKNGTNIRDITVPEHMRVRIKTGLAWFDEVFGGEGLVPSQCGIFTGTPGAGKTTACLQLADSLMGAGHVALFNTCEESGYQVKMTAERLNLKNGFVFGQDRLVSDIIKHAKELIDKQVKGKKAKDKKTAKQLFLILDSLPCFDDGKYADGGTNSMTAVRVTEQLTDFCKKGYKGVHPIMIMIGHVTKGGQFAGKQQVKHTVDFHAHLFIDEQKNSDTYGHRLLELQKNRFGCNGTRLIMGINSSGLYKMGSYEWA